MHHYFSFASTCRLILHHLSPKCKGFLSSVTLADSSLRVYSTPAHSNAGCVMERSPDAPASSVSSQTTDTSWMGWLSICNPACHLHPWVSHAAFDPAIYINLPWSLSMTLLQDYMYVIYYGQAVRDWIGYQNGHVDFTFTPVRTCYTTIPRVRHVWQSPWFGLCVGALWYVT